MTLFRALEYWSTKCGVDEEFDRGCIAIGDVDNSKSYDKIVVGSFSGMLRIYHPSGKQYKPHDLVLEKQLEGPILQVEIGRFIPGDQTNLALAVLMQRKLVVYVVKVVEKQSEISYCQLVKLYEHQLQRLAYNFTYGPFGGVYGKDLICVQSFDGQLAFYAQDHFMFARFMTNFLVPGPLCYSKSMDCFITFNSHLEVCAYKYHVLAASYASNEKESTQGGKRIQVDWAVNIGEDVVDIKIAKYGQNLSSSQSEIVVLGERTLYCIKENGVLSSQKRFDFSPSAFCSYPQSKQSTKENLIVATHNKTLMIYNDPKMIWACSVNVVPVAVHVGTFGGIHGMIVMLDDTGNLSINYLGTDPQVQAVTLLESKELDFSEMDKEYKSLQEQIRYARKVGREEPKSLMNLKVQLPNVAVHTPDEDTFSKLTFNVVIEYAGEMTTLNDVTITIKVSKPLVVLENDIAIPELKCGGGTPYVCKFQVLCEREFLPSNLNATALVVYTLPESDHSMTATCNFKLPLSLVGKPIYPKKSATYKITLEANKMFPEVPELFEDLEVDIETQGILSSNKNILSFQYNNGMDATLLISKSSNRCRIQSGSFEALFLLTDELVNRLKRRYNSEKQEDKEAQFRISYSDNIPFKPYFNCIDTHFQQRVLLRQLNNDLRNQAHQFRSIQKRLLIRYKERNPTPLNNIDYLFHLTYNKLINTANKVEETQQRLSEAANLLSAATRLILLLAQLNMDLSDSQIDILRHFLSPEVDDSEELGWEEITFASMTQLLCTCLAKSAKESAAVPQQMKFPNDTEKLQKRIVLVFDRLLKGGQLYMEQPVKKKIKKKKQK